MAVKKTDDVLLIGALEPAFEAELRARLRHPKASRRRRSVPHSWPNTGPNFAWMMTSGPPGVDADLIAALPNLEAIVNNGDGVDAIDLDAAEAPGYRREQYPRRAVGLRRRYGTGPNPDGAAAFWRGRPLRTGSSVAGEGPFPYARDVSGLQVGILGLGRIGSAIATRLLGFDCAIAYHNRHRIDGSPYRYAESRWAVGRVGRCSGGSDDGRPRDPPPRRSRRAGGAGARGYLINIARGSVVDQDALVELLAGGDLAGAGLDVFADEPHVPAELFDLDNVVLFPHIGSATARTRRAMALLAIRNLESYLATGELVTPVLRPRR